MADLVTRLLLNSSNFDNNIVKSTQQVKQLQNIGKTVGASLKSSFMLAAGGAGIAMGGIEAFNKLMSHSQAMTDGFNSKMEQAKAHTDSFFASVANGNLNSFVNGWQNVNKSAETYAKALDDASTATTLITPEIELHKTKYNDLMAKAKDVSLSEGDRLRYLTLASGELDKQIKYAQTLQKIEEFKNFSGIENAFTKEHGMPTNKKTLNYMLAVDPSTGEAKYQKILSDYKKKQDSEYKKAYEKVYGKGSSKWLNKNDPQVMKELQKDASYNNFKIAKSLDAIENTDDGQKLLTEYKMGIVKAEQLKEYIDNAKKDWSKLEQKITKGAGSSGSKGTKDKELSPEQSIAYYNQELTKANTQFNSAVSDSARAAIQQKINELKEVIRVMNFNASHPNAPTNLKSENGSMSGHTSLKVSGNNPGAGLNVHPVYTKKDVATTNDYADALNATANAMSTLNTAMDGGNKTFLSFAAVSGGAIAQMIIQLQALAGAKGIAGAFSMPFPASLAAVATVVSTVASVFASLPKFAEGGVIGGNSTIGDFNLARVNSGEMILNGSQQANLFSMLNNGNVGSNTQKLEGTVKLKGSDLYICLSNHLSKLNKIR